MYEKILSMIKTANAFANASRIIQSSQVGNSDLDDVNYLRLSSFPIGALSLEIYFKALFVLEYGKEPPKKHDFYREIYKKLPVETQEELKNIFSRKMQHRDMTDIKMFENESGLIVPKNFDDLLDSWSKVFANFRYLYDLKKLSNGDLFMLFLPEIINTVSCIIHQRLNKKF